MKKVFFLVLALAMLSVTGRAADVQNRVHPNEAAYKIEGDFGYRIVGNEVWYELKNVVTTGLQIQQKDVYQGKQPDGKEVMFTFDHIKADDPKFPGFDNISYWFFDPDMQDWQPDSEIKKGERTNQSSKDITVMLIIDCSSSLQNDFEIVKRATNRFIDQLYQAAPQGNVHIGIVGFSSMPETRVLPLQPLNQLTYYSMRTFVSSLRVNNGTALFYAWDQALDMTANYIQSGKMNNYSESHFITFTDGIDQTSQDKNHRPTPIVSADDYYDYIIKTAKGKVRRYESDVVFVKGSDITNAQQQAKFENKLSRLAEPNDNFHYERLESIERLEYKFERIASRLTESWQILNCYVAPARHGRVCWTFGRQEHKVEQKHVPVAKTGRNIFLGLGGSIGLPFIYYQRSQNYVSGGYASSSYVDVIEFGITPKFALDFSYPITDHFGMGIYTTLGAGMVYDTYNGAQLSFDFKVGLLMTAGNINDRPFLIGIAPFTGVTFAGYMGVVPLEIKFGRAINEHLYVTGNLNFFVPNAGVEPSITIGYHFGDKFQTQR